MIITWIKQIKKKESVIILTPFLLNFFKTIIILKIVPTVDFGRFALYTSSAVAMTYLFNSGFYEGSITYFTSLSLSQRCKRIVSLRVQLELASLVMLFITLIVVVVACNVFKLSESIFIFGAIISSHGQSHLNLMTSHLRARGDILRLGYVMVARSCFSFIITVSLVKLFNFKISEAYLFDGIAIAVCFIAHIYHGVRFKHFFKIFETIKIVNLGIWQCYASAVRSLLFAVERFFASILLSPTDMGQYAKIMVFYQVATTSGGLIAQFFQQSIVIKSLSKGVKSVGLRILRFQIYLMVTISAIILLFLFSIYQCVNVSVIESLELNLLKSALFAVLFSGIIEGTSVFDSLALASNKGFLLIRLRLSVLFAFIAGLILVVPYVELWTITHQSVAFLLLTILNYFISIMFIYLHHEIQLKVSTVSAIDNQRESNHF